jgi:hypothetical protein
VVVMAGNKPQWVCDVCTFEMPAVGGVVLYNRSRSARHYPSPRVVCGSACAVLAESQLQAGEVVRLPWSAFLQALTPAAG